MDERVFVEKSESLADERITYPGEPASLVRR
jgi:hypothetical protein